MYACHINPSLLTYTPYRVGGDKVDLISLSYDHITFNLSLSPGFTVAFQGLPLIEIKRPTKLQRKTCSPIILCNFQFVMPMHNYSKCECRMQVNMYNLLVKNIFFSEVSKSYLFCFSSFLHKASFLVHGYKPSLPEERVYRKSWENLGFHIIQLSEVISLRQKLQLRPPPHAEGALAQKTSLFFFSCDICKYILISFWSKGRFENKFSC